MANLDQTRTEPSIQFWEQLSAARTVMLYVEGSEQHAQPMAPFIEKETRTIWFFTNRSTDLVRTLNAGAMARAVYASTDGDYFVSLRGVLSENKDPTRIDNYWNDVVAAWYNGQDDPEMTMLQLTAQDAAIWATSGNPLIFGFEIMKARIGENEPNIGERAHITFTP